MKTSMLLTTALAAALAALPAAPNTAEAATGDGVLLRCRAPDGTIGYTDRNCSVFGAQAVPIDADLVVRIARDRAYEARLQAAAAGADAAFDMDSATMVQGGLAATDAGAGAAAPPGRRSPTSGCARSPSQLANDLHASVALGDVNRIAESYHFAGMSTAAGERVLDRLQHYAGRPVVDTRYYGTTLAMAGTDAGEGATTGMVQLVLAEDGSVADAVDFEVERYAGCYFVSFA
jgi:hypothetical protein